MSLIQEKLAQAVGLLKEFRIDCWITFVRETSMLTDPTLPFLAPSDLTWHSALVVTASGERVAIVGKYDKQMLDEAKAYDEVIAYVEGFRKPLQELLRRIKPASIALNYSTDSEIADGLTHGMFLTMQEVLRELGMHERMVSAEPVISALRQRKTETELNAMRKAIAQTEEIFALVAEHIRPGMTEATIADFMKREVARRGLTFAWNEATCPAVFTGPDTANAHYHPTERRVEQGHILNMDFGVKVDSYCSDLQRTFYVLRPGETDAPVEVRKGFNTITRSIEAARALMRPGAKGVDVDGAARRVIVEAGYEEFPHGLGHQVGRFAHDGTALLGPAWEKYGKKPFQVLEEGMVFTIEPRLTVPGYGVVTIENMVVVRASGAEYLSTPQTELRLLRS
ncbi:MAG: Xaa-Pro peptidase family protein [Bacteroidetes bacterium]|nr:Xaa-Pro peptidase family protein [Bacteroidota bacterium]